MSNLIRNKWVVFIFRVILGVVFLYASFDKIRDPGSFASNIQNYQVLPYSLTNIFAIILPWLELYVGACLILGVFVDGAVLLSGGMMIMFIIAISQAIIRGLDIDCGCGIGEKTLPLDRLKEDIYLLITAFIIKFRDRILSCLLGKRSTK